MSLKDIRGVVVLTKTTDRWVRDEPSGLRPPRPFLGKWLHVDFDPKSVRRKCEPSLSVPRQRRYGNQKVNRRQEDDANRSVGDCRPGRFFRSVKLVLGDRRAR